MKKSVFMNNAVRAASALLLVLSLCSPVADTVRADDVEESPGPQRSATCVEHSLKVHGEKNGGMAGLSEEFQEYLPLVERALAYRDESIKVATRLKEKIASGEPLSGEDLDRLNSGTIAHISIRKEIYSFAEAHECWTDKTYLSHLSPEARLEGIMISLSAALVLYDNYLLAVSVFEEDSKLRRFLNERDSGYDKGLAELAKVTVSYNSAYNRGRVRTAIKFYEREIGKMPQAFLEGEEASYLNLLITQSPSYNMTRSFSPLHVAARKLRFLSAMTVDVLKGLTNEGVNLFSMAFGNTVGLIESRKGKLHGRSEVLAYVEGNLKAGDILLEKTPFRLTDKFIPGHWGHAAIWVGTEEELKELGIWDHPLVVKNRDAVKAGRSVVEALRSGVEMNSLPHFMNIDDLAVLRLREMGRDEKIQAILLALRQVGKGYDFNFDVETTDRIVCSELVYTVFTGIQWPTDRTLGRATISPDNVAVKALDDGPLEQVLLYHEGELVNKEPVAVMKRLIKRG